MARQIVNTAVPFEESGVECHIDLGDGREGIAIFGLEDAQDRLTFFKMLDEVAPLMDALTNSDEEGEGGESSVKRVLRATERELRVIDMLKQGMNDAFGESFVVDAIGETNELSRIIFLLNLVKDYGLEGYDIEDKMSKLEAQTKAILDKRKNRAARRAR